MTTFTTGAPPHRNDPLALNEAKGLGNLLGGAWSIWRRKPTVFLLTAAIVVIPIYVVMDGVVGHGFTNPGGRPTSWIDTLQSILLGTFATALVTATHARAVVALAQGKPVGTLSALRLGVRGAGFVLLASIAYFAAAFVGYLAILIPGIYISVAGTFTAPSAAIEGKGPSAALLQSFALTRHNGWWRTFGYCIALLIGTSILAAAVRGILVGFDPNSGPTTANFGYVTMPILAVVQAIAMSWTALVLTLLYFSWRASAGEPYTDGIAVPDEPQVRDAPRTVAMGSGAKRSRAARESVVDPLGRNKKH